MKLKYSSIIALSLVIVCFVSFTRSYSEITLNKEQMEALDGQEVWWGDVCGCYFFATCADCYLYSWRDCDNSPYYSTHCEGTTDVCYMKKIDNPVTHASCEGGEEGFTISCGNYWNCYDEDCDDCYNTAGCVGCSYPTVDSGDCEFFGE